MGLINWFNTGKWTVEKEGNSWFYSIDSLSTNYSDANKLKMVLSNPAALFLFTLLPDLASMGHFKLRRKGSEDLIENHPILDRLNNPNPMQTGTQFLWDYMFWRLLGTANLYFDSKIPGQATAYFLSPDCIMWPRWFDDNGQTLFISDGSIRELEEKRLRYKTKGQDHSFKYGQLKQFHDISNGLTSWFRGPSRLDALKKVISNSDNSLDSKNITSHLARKFMVSGKGDVRSTSTLPMSPDEKKSIEDSMMSKKNIHAVKYMADIKSFVQDAKVLESLDKAFLNDALVIAKVLKNIPRDAIDLLASSTYENQEKGKAVIVSYCIQPSMDDFAKGVLDYFGEENLKLEVDYSHIPFVQVFEEQKAITEDRKASAFMKQVSGGVKPAIAYENIYGEQLSDSDFNDPVRLVGSSSEGSETKLKKIV